MIKPTHDESMGMRGLLSNASNELSILERLLGGPIEICQHGDLNNQVVQIINNKLRDFKYGWRLEDDGEFLSLVPTGPQPAVSTTV